MANSDAIGLKDHDGTGGEVLADGFEVGKHERSDLGGATIALAAQSHDRREHSVRHGQQFTASRGPQRGAVRNRVTDSREPIENPSGAMDAFGVQHPNDRADQAVISIRVGIMWPVAAYLRHETPPLLAHNMLAQPPRSRDRLVRMSA